MAVDRRDPEADLALWQEVLDAVMAGRTAGHVCPECGEKAVEAEIDDLQTYMVVKCTACGRFVEGVLA